MTPRAVAQGHHRQRAGMTPRAVAQGHHQPQAGAAGLIFAPAAPGAPAGTSPACPGSLREPT